MFSSKNAKDKMVLLLRAGSAIVVLIVVIAILFTSMAKNSFAARPRTPTPEIPTPTPIGCVSAADCLSQMTLDEKIGQMTQANKSALTTPSDIRTYYLGSLLSGGGEGPNGSGGTATEWANMYDNFQAQALQTRLKIPLIYGADAVHGHNNVYSAVIFPHHIGMGATRNAALVQQADQVTRDEVLGTGIDWVFAPCVCVPRDDRWGRTYEGYGEDPALVSSMSPATPVSSPMPAGAATAPARPPWSTSPPSSLPKIQAGTSIGSTPATWPPRCSKRPIRATILPTGPCPKIAIVSLPESRIRRSAP